MSQLDMQVTLAGRPFTELPKDLFIPPDALQILLDSFTGPLDLLLYLIRQHNIDIMDIPMAVITNQYLEYIDLLESRRIELAADYLVMAAWLLEIKSKLLLPTCETGETISEEDPRMALVQRLQIYEQFKQAALALDKLPRLEREYFQVFLSFDTELIEKVEPEIGLSALEEAMRRLLLREDHGLQHQICREILSVHDRMSRMLQALQDNEWVEFKQFLIVDEERMGVIVTLLAILELAKQSLIMITQSAVYSPIYLQAKQDG